MLILGERHLRAEGVLVGRASGEAREADLGIAAGKGKGVKSTRVTLPARIGASRLKTVLEIAPAV